MTISASIALLLALQAAPPPSGAAHPAAQTNLTRLISTDDYPIQALRNNEQGQVAVRLDVDKSGSVSGCAITGSSGSASLDQTTCALLQQRARFRPARDAKGRPVADTVTQTIMWRINQSTADPAVEAASKAFFICAATAASGLAHGNASNEAVVARATASCAEQERSVLAATAKAAPGSGPNNKEELRRGFRMALLEAVRMMRPPAVRAKPATGAGGLVSLISNDDYPPPALRNEEQGVVGVRLAIDAAGLVSGCTVTESSGSPSLDSGTCTLLQQRARFTPARDKKGLAVADTFAQRVSWRISDDSASNDAASPALQQWVRCVGGEARRLAPGATAIETVADRAFAACTAAEQAAAAAIGEPSPEGGAKIVPGTLRDSVRKTILDLVRGIRASGGG